MAWMNIQGAVIMAIVAFVALKIAGGPIANAFWDATNAAGIPLGDPKIGSFSATPVEGGNVAFTLSLGGNYHNAVLEIFQSKASDTDAELKEPTPSYAISNLVYTSKTSGGAQKLEKKLTLKCPDGSECTCKTTKIQPVCPENFKPGLYKFSAVVKKKGETQAKQVKHFTLGFYNDDYLELFDKPVKDCEGNPYNCDVIECKRVKLGKDLGKKDKCTEGVKILYTETVGLFGMQPSGCQYPTEPAKKDDPLVSLDFARCGASEIDSAYSRAAMLEFYSRVCRDADVSALTEFRNLVEKLAKKSKTVDGVKTEVKNDLAQCTAKLENHLKKLGWTAVNPNGKRKEYYGRQITDYLSKSKYAQPNLDSAAMSSTDAGQLTAFWAVPVGMSKVKNFQIIRVVTEAVDPKTGKAQTFSKASSPGLEVCKGIRSICSFTSLFPAEHIAGWHEFIITAASIDDNSFVSNKLTVSRGLYNRRFLELYQKHPNGCTDEKKCNVIEKKKFLIKSSAKASEVYKMEDVRKSINDAGCVYDASKGMDECTEPEAVDMMYREIMKITYPNVEQREELSGFPCLEQDNPQGRVCKAKRELKAELDGKGWLQVVVDTPLVITPSEIKVQEFRLEPRYDGTIKATWVLSGPAEKIESFEIMHQHSRFARNKDDQFVNVLPVYAVSKKENVVEIEFGPFEGRFDGYHRFTLKALDVINYEMAASPTVLAGFYDDQYIELYDGDADKCGNYRTYKDEGCDVIGKKRQFLKKNGAAKKIYDENREIKGMFDCDFDRLYNKGEGCRPEAVHVLYEATIKKQYPDEGQQKDFLTVDGCKIDTGDICKAKKNLANTLHGLGWIKITARAEKTQPMLPETTYVAKTVPENPLPGELFKLVVKVQSTHPIRWLKIQEAGSTEWKALPCDWLSKSCKREWVKLYFEPSPKPIRISVVDVTDRASELPPFTPAASTDCRNSHKISEKWAGCLSKVNEEVLFECSADGTVKSTVASKEEDRRMSSFLCGGIVDYGETGATGQGECIYSCMFDVDCRATGGSVAPYACPAENYGYGGVKLSKVCCDIGIAGEMNLKTVSVLSIITGIMNQNIEANEVGGFFFFLDLINPIKMFTEGAKIGQRQDKLNIMEKLAADAVQGTHLASVVGTMNNLRLNEKEKRRYLDQKYNSIREKFRAFTTKLVVDAGSENKEVREKANERLKWLGPVIADDLRSYTLEQRGLDEIAIAHSNDQLVLDTAKYDALTWNDDPRQTEVLDDVYFELGELFKGLGDDGAAVEVYNLVVEYFPESDRAVEARNKVDSLQSLKHRALVFTKSFAIDIFGDPLFYVFGGPKALMSIGKASAVGFMAKSRQMVNIASKGGSLTKELIVSAATDSRISKAGAEALGKELASSAGKLTVKAVETLREIAGGPIKVFKARRIKALIDEKGFQSFETAELATGKTLRVRFLKGLEDLARLDPRRAEEVVGEVRKSYTTLMVQHGLLLTNPKDQEMAIRLLQGGLNNDEVLSVVKGAGKLADDSPVLRKAITGFLEPQYGISNPKLARAVLIAKASPEALEEAQTARKLATEFILTTGKNNRPYLMALAKDGKTVTYQFRSTLGSIDEVGPMLAEKYTAVMGSFPELLDGQRSVRNVLRLVQRDFEPAEIGELLTKQGKASSQLRKKFINNYLRKAHGITEEEDAIRVLDSGLDPKVVGVVKADLFTKRKFAELLKQRRVLQKRLSKGVEDAADVESELQELASEIAHSKELITPGAKIYDKGGRLTAVLGRETGSVSLVPEHFPSFFNQLVVLRVRAADAAYSALQPLAAGAETVVSAAHTAAVDYAIPAAKIVKTKALDPQFRAMLLKRMSLPSVSSMDLAKANLQTAEKFMASGAVAVVAIPVVVVNEDSTEELAFVTFGNSDDLVKLVPDAERFYVPDGTIAECSYFDVLVECMTDDHVSRSAIPVFAVNNVEDYVLANLNMRNLEDFSMERQEWLREVVFPLTINIEVTSALTEEEEDTMLEGKVNGLLDKAGLAYDTAKEFRGNGLTDLEVQTLLFNAKGLDGFNALESLPVEQLEALTS